MSKVYTPKEVAIKVLEKAEELTKSAIAGLKAGKISPVPGVISPLNGNSATPTKVGSQAVVKRPKAKRMGQALDKPSVFFKSEDFGDIKKSSIENLRCFLEKQRKKADIR
jgi:hypothetical protein